MASGCHYAWDYAKHEPVHAAVVVCVLATGIAWSLRQWMEKRSGASAAFCLFLGLGLQVLYVITVGGDFMRGRFLVSTVVGTAVMGCWLLDRVLPACDLRRSASVVLAGGLALACYQEGGGVSVRHLPVAVDVLVRQMDGMQALLMASFVALPTLFFIAMAYLVFRTESVRAVLVFIALLMAQSVYLLALIGGAQPPAAVSIMMATALGASCFIFALLTAGRRLARPMTATAMVVLVAAVSALCDVRPRIAEIDSGGITDEYAWYSGRWNEGRFRPPPAYSHAPVQMCLTGGLMLQRYSETHGPITIAWFAMGILPYHAGAKVTVIDQLGLTDAFVARCPANANSRVGHIIHEIPDAYDQTRGILNVFPDWQIRITELDGRLVRDANRLSRQVQWEDEAAHRLWQNVRLVISGDLWSRERLRAIPAYAWGGR
jgi:hypothetical protein